MSCNIVNCVIGKINNLEKKINNTVTGLWKTDDNKTIYSSVPTAENLVFPKVGTQYMLYQSNGSFSAGQETGAYWSSAGKNSVSFGTDNNVTGISAVVFGQDNKVEQEAGAIVGGAFNNITTTGAVASIIGGGISNNITNGYASAIMGSYLGQIGTTGPVIYNNFIGGGNSNKINNGNRNGIIGGTNNNLSGSDNTIAGGNNHNLSGNDNTICGGGSNVIETGSHSVLVGGDTNKILSGERNTISGGLSNTIGSTGSANNNCFIGGGRNNLITNGDNSIVMGTNCDVKHSNVIMLNTSGSAKSSSNTGVIHLHTSNGLEYSGPVGATGAATISIPIIINGVQYFIDAHQ